MAGRARNMMIITIAAIPPPMLSALGAGGIVYEFLQPRLSFFI